MTRTQKETIIRSQLERMGITFDEEAPGRLAVYHEMLADWNTRMNLTGDADFEIILHKHILDSLSPLGMTGILPSGGALIDVGSGAGFPGLPLAIARPDWQVTLLDSLAKRIHFLQAVTDELGLVNVIAIHARAEEAAHRPALRESYDIAAARAVAPLSVLCELLLPFVKTGGKMLCYKGPAAEAEIPSGNRAAAKLGGSGLQMSPVVLPGLPELRHSLVICEKKEKTVRHYPRKSGTPNREPLGQSDKD